MKVLVFDLQAKLAHFRRPDTTSTHVTYPFITRTALRGMLGSILGMEEFCGEAWTGIQLLSPVKTVSQELSLLGKGFLGGGGDSFNRPTSIELVVNPHYRIYYQGEHLEELAAAIREQRSGYHTYLGSAFALTVPRYVNVVEMQMVPLDEAKTKELHSCTVVPVQIIRQLSVHPQVQYGRVGGILYESIGGRRFRGAVHVVYEVEGKPVHFYPRSSASPEVRILASGQEEVVCLW